MLKPAKISIRFPMHVLNGSGWIDCVFTWSVCVVTWTLPYQCVLVQREFKRPANMFLTHSARKCNRAKIKSFKLQALPYRWPVWHHPLRPTSVLVAGFGDVGPSGHVTLLVGQCRVQSRPHHQPTLDRPEPEAGLTVSEAVTPLTRFPPVTPNIMIIRDDYITETNTV